MNYTVNQRIGPGLDLSHGFVHYIVRHQYQRAQEHMLQEEQRRQAALTLHREQQNVHGQPAVPVSCNTNIGTFTIDT